MKKNRFFKISVLLILSLFVGPAQARAVNEFKTFCKVSYHLFESGDSSVTQEISLVNQRPDIYVSEYSLKFSGESIQNIKAWDNKGPLDIQVNNQGETKTIILKFNEKVVGKDQALSFIVKYEIPKLAKKEGQIWKMVLPKIRKENLPEEHSVSVSVPLEFGSLAFASPYPRKSENIQGARVLYFEKNDLTDLGVLLEFGNFQVFNFSFFYHLENKKEFTTNEKITLPPDTAYQIVNYDKLEPAPKNVVRDNDGNWLAEYELKPNSRIEVKAEGKVKIFPGPINPNVNNFFNPEAHLNSQKYWEVTSPEIQKISKNLKTPRQIYDYVASKLIYDYSRVESDRSRMGALEALRSPNNSLCLEFTDLYVTLARAAGIPAREIEGYAYTDNPKLRPLSLVQDILHAWPEYFDTENSSWKMIDPTWGKTTEGFDYFNNFDMSHFTFVIHGLDSQFPPPVGSFKFQGEEGKNVFVEYGEDFTFPESQLSVELFFLKQSLFKKEIQGEIVITNAGTGAIYNLPIEVLGSESLNPIVFQSTIPYLIPFQNEKISMTINSKTPLFKNIDDYVTIKLAEKEYKKNVSIKIIGKEILYGFIFLILIFLFIITVAKIIKISKKEKML